MTGHTGFKGSWLCLLLGELGARVHGYALKAEPESLYELLKLDDVVARSALADVRDASALREALDAAEPDMVFHLAAQPLVLSALETPAETLATNIMGTVNLLEALRLRQGGPTTVVVSSDKCYRNVENAAPYREDDPLGGSDPYTASKACTEIVANAYRESYFAQAGLPLATARAGNVLGGGDFGANRLVPDLYRSAGNATPIVLRYPGAVRPWQYVLDVLWGYVTLAGSLMLGGMDYARAYNFAPSPKTPLRVGAIVEQILPLWGMDPSRVEVETPLHPETKTLLIDPDRAMRGLGWKNRLDSAAMIRETASWYKLLLDGDSGLKSYSLAQLRRYLNEVKKDD